MPHPVLVCFLARFITSPFMTSETIVDQDQLASDLYPNCFQNRI